MSIPIIHYDSKEINIGHLAIKDIQDLSKQDLV